MDMHPFRSVITFLVRDFSKFVAKPVEVFIEMQPQSEIGQPRVD